MVVDDTGMTGSKGCGAYGMLGHGDEENRLRLTVIEALQGETVVQVSAGTRHGMMLLEDGTLTMVRDIRHVWAMGICKTGTLMATCP